MLSFRVAEAVLDFQVDHLHLGVQLFRCLRKMLLTALSGARAKDRVSLSRACLAVCEEAVIEAVHGIVQNRLTLGQLLSPKVILAGEGGSRPLNMAGPWAARSLTPPV